MKRKRALLATTLACAGGVCHAQSSVQLYGSIDAGLTYVTNEGGSKNFKTDNGIISGNRWGFKGVEDLGGGISTIFKIEGGFNISSGKANQGGAIFGRQDWVGLQGPFGTFKIGNQYDMVNDFVTVYNVSYDGSGYANHQGDFDRIAGDRNHNAVKYTSNVYGGFQAGAMYAFSNTAGDFHDGSAWSAGGQYNGGPVSVGIAYSSLATPTLDPYAAIGTPLFFGTTVATYSASGAATDTATAFQLKSMHALDVGGSYRAGKWLFEGNFTNTTLNAFTASSVMHVYEGGVEYDFTPVVRGVLGYQHTTFQGHTWNQGSGGLAYRLSKRTKVYVSGDYVKASSGVDADLGGNFTPARSRSQADARVGIYTVF
ncbi:MAG: porin [Janthinobacterium lividum]